MVLEAILFDLDGVLVSAKEWHYHALNKALDEIAGTVITEWEHLHTFDGRPSHVKLAMLVELGRVTEEQIPHIWRLKQEHTVEYIRNLCQPDEQKIFMLSQLRQDGFRIACVSNAIKVSVELMLEKSAIRSFFEEVVSCEEAKAPKPDPAPYLVCLDRMGLTADQAVAIEDNERGYESSRAAGIKTLVLQYPEVTIENVRGGI